MKTAERARALRPTLAALTTALEKRVRAPDWGRLVTVPARQTILVTDESAARLHTLDSLMPSRLER